MADTVDPEHDKLFIPLSGYVEVHTSDLVYTSPKDAAAQLIQKAFRRWRDMCVFRFLRDAVLTAEASSAQPLLKKICPADSSLLADGYKVTAPQSMADRARAYAGGTHADTRVVVWSPCRRHAFACGLMAPHSPRVSCIKCSRPASLCSTCPPPWPFHGEARPPQTPPKRWVQCKQPACISRTHHTHRAR